MQFDNEEGFWVGRRRLEQGSIVVRLGHSVLGPMQIGGAQDDPAIGADPGTESACQVKAFRTGVFIELRTTRNGEASPVQDPARPGSEPRLVFKVSLMFFRPNQHLAGGERHWFGKVLHPDSMLQ